MGICHKTKCSTEKETKVKEPEFLNISNAVQLKMQNETPERKNYWVKSQHKILNFYMKLFSQPQLKDFSLIKITVFKIFKTYYNKFEVLKERKFVVIKENTNKNQLSHQHKEDIIDEIKSQINNFYVGNIDLLNFNEIKNLDPTIVQKYEKTNIMLKMQKIQQNISLKNMKEEYISISDHKISIFIFFNRMESLNIYDIEKIKEISDICLNHENKIDLFLVYVHEISSDQLLRSIQEYIDEKGLSYITNIYLMEPEECKKYIKRSDTNESDGCFLFDKGILKYSGEILDFYTDDLKFYISNLNIIGKKHDYDNNKRVIYNYCINKINKTNLWNFPYQYEIHFTRVNKYKLNSNQVFEKQLFILEPVHVNFSYISKEYKKEILNLDSVKNNLPDENFCLIEILNDFYKNIAKVSENISLYTQVSYNNNEIAQYVLSNIINFASNDTKNLSSIEIENNGNFEKMFNYNKITNKIVHLYYQVNDNNLNNVYNNSQALFKKITAFNKYNISDIIFHPEINQVYSKNKNLNLLFKGKFDEKELLIDLEYSKPKIILILNDIQGNIEKDLNDVLTILDLNPLSNFTFLPIFIGYGNIDFDFSKYKNLNFENIIHLSNNRQNFLNIKFWFHSNNFYFKYTFFLLDTDGLLRYVGNFKDIDILSTIKALYEKRKSLIILEQEIFNDNLLVKEIKSKLSNYFKQMNLNYNPFVQFNYTKKFEYENKNLKKICYKDLKLNIIVKDKTEEKNQQFSSFLNDLSKIMKNMNLIRVPTFRLNIPINEVNIMCSICNSDVFKSEKNIRLLKKISLALDSNRMAPDSDDLFTSKIRTSNSNSFRSSLFYNQYTKSFICVSCEGANSINKDSSSKQQNLIYLSYDRLKDEDLSEIIKEFFECELPKDTQSIKCYICEEKIEAMVSQGCVFMLLNSFQQDMELTWDNQPSKLKYSPVYICKDNCLNILQGSELKYFNMIQDSKEKKLNISNKPLILKKFYLEKSIVEGAISSRTNSYNSYEEDDRDKDIVVQN